MAFGGNNNQNGNGRVTPTYYSRFKVYNPDEKLTLSLNYWNGMMKLSLDKFIQSQNGYSAQRDEIIAVYVSPIKARLFATCISNVMNSNGDSVFGIDTGVGDVRGLIAIGRKAGVPFIGLGKVNNDGSYENYQEYKFAKDTFYTLNIKDLKKLNFDKVYDNGVELEQLYHATVDFANAMGGAYAYAVHDIGRYDSGRTSNTLLAIANAVGARVGKGHGGGGNSFFDGAGSGESKGKGGAPEGFINVDDLDDELGFN